MSGAVDDTSDAAPRRRRRLADLDAALVAERARSAALLAERDTVTRDRDRLRDAYRELQLELELMRRRLFVAKAERLDTAQLELEFSGKLAALDALNQRLGLSALTATADGTDGSGTGPKGSETGKRKPTGRRELKEVDLPEVRLELPDPLVDATTRSFAWEESSQMCWRRGGFFRLVIARKKYLNPGAVTEPAASALATHAPNQAMLELMSTIITAPMPPQILPRSIATASLLAHIVSDKFCDGLPLHRQEDRFARLGFRIDRGTMSRWVEDLGMIVGSSVVEAMRDEAMRTAFCISTDATGVLVQPVRASDEKRGDKKRRACRRGHFFVQIADTDHVFFEYTDRETKAAVGEMFKGFSGYVQADAKNVYDFLFTPPDERPPDDDGEPDLAVRHEVGCWSHCRRRLWESAVTTKNPVAREAVLRIKRLYDLDRTWRGRPHAEIKSLREIHLRPHTDAFFAWVAVEYERVKDIRGLLRSALGYAHRQRGPLTRFFDDGRLCLDNNASERELRRIAVGRKAWLFVGSDDHAQAAGNLLTLVASSRLHRLDPEVYLRDLFRVLPHWPTDRYLELAPRYWLDTRARLDPEQLEAELGPLTIPDPTTSSEQPAAR